MTKLCQENRYSNVNLMWATIKRSFKGKVRKVMICSVGVWKRNWTLSTRNCSWFQLAEMTFPRSVLEITRREDLETRMSGRSWGFIVETKRSKNSKNTDNDGVQRVKDGGRTPSKQPDPEEEKLVVVQKKDKSIIKS